MSAGDIDRYVRLAAHDLEVLGLLRKAAESARPTRDVSDWSVTLLYYVSCVLVKALARTRGKDFQDHFTLKTWLNTTQDLLAITKPYRKLEDRSRDARYEGRKFSAAELEATVVWFERIRDHVVSLLRTIGISEIPPLDARPSLVD